MLRSLDVWSRSGQLCLGNLLWSLSNCSCPIGQLGSFAQPLAAITCAAGVRSAVARSWAYATCIWPSSMLADQLRKSPGLWMDAVSAVGQLLMLPTAGYSVPATVHAEGALQLWRRNYVGLWTIPPCIASRVAACFKDLWMGVPAAQTATNGWSVPPLLLAAL